MEPDLVLSQLYNNLLSFFNRHRPSFSYGILQKCKRCTYQKSSEPILIYSLHRGPRVIIFPNSKCYLRKGECIDFNKCGKCFEQVENLDRSLKCNWIEF